ncbi:MAG: aminotransferase class V-fold PLP-dependent enzyme [Proteobacteria bacterium]|nr:aminotransferase class V-fold PLP-dependent enzyme [Pseudomonadota bacterium]
MIYQIEPSFNKKTLKNLQKYIISGSWFTEHTQTKLFEKKFQSFLKSKNVILYPNGTLTMSSILSCLNIKKEDEVLVSNYTMVATPNAPLLAGAKVNLVDISSQNLCMCPIDLKRKITKKTKFVIYTSMNGRAGNILEILKICKQNKIYLIEDAAHSIGSFYKGKHLGTYGVAGSFSFSMPKLITMGQGGAITTNNNLLAKKLRKFKDFGRVRNGMDIHNSLGYNFKITDMQAVLGLGQLDEIKLRLNSKRNLYDTYYELLKDNNKIKIFRRNKDETPWSFDLYSPFKSKIKKILSKNNIVTRDVYPPINNQKIYNHIKGLKVSNFYCKQGIWLPSSINLKKKQIKKICNLINSI